MYFRSSHHSLNRSELHTFPTFTPNHRHGNLRLALVWPRHPVLGTLQTAAMQTKGQPAPPRNSRISSQAHGFGKKNSREIQLEIKGNEKWGQSLANVGLKDNSDQDPLLGKCSPTPWDLRRIWAAEIPFFLPGMKKKIGDYLCQSNLNGSTKRSVYKDLSEMRRMKNRIILSISFWMRTDFVPSKYTIQSPFQILPPTGTAAE